MLKLKKYRNIDSDDNNTATRTITQIANDMDRIAKRRADVNRLNGAKLRAYKMLEIELNYAKANKTPESAELYMQVISQLKSELGIA